MKLFEEFEDKSKSSNQFKCGSERTLNQLEDAQAYDNMVEVAGLLTSTSINNWVYEVEDCYLDYGQRWMWTTIICHDNEGDTHQVLNPAEWVQICNAKSDEELKQIVDSIKADEYFQDRDRGVKEDLNNPLKDAQNKAKKKQKGMSPFSYLNPDAGDVETGVAAFNHAMGNSCEGGECMGESLDSNLKGLIAEEREYAESVRADLGDHESVYYWVVEADEEGWEELTDQWFDIKDAIECANRRLSGKRPFRFKNSKHCWVERWVDNVPSNGGYDDEPESEIDVVYDPQGYKDLEENLNENYKEYVHEQTSTQKGFYIGDICYALDDDTYDTVWGGANYVDGKYDVNGYSFIVGSTAYGDGEYTDQHGNVYGVDAGNIGIVPLELCTGDSEDNLKHLGNVLYTTGVATFECENGIFDIATPNETIHIDTAGNTYDDDDEWYMDESLNESTEEIPANTRLVYEVTEEGIENGEEFYKQHFSSENLEEAIAEFENIKKAFEENTEAQNTYDIKNAEEWHLINDYDDEMPIVRYEGINSEDYLELYVNSAEYSGDSVEDTNLEEDLVDSNTDFISSQNANYEQDRETTRQMRTELAKQGIATDMEGNPLNEDTSSISLEDFMTHINYNGAEYRGAEIPAAIDTSINQVNLPDNMRLKSFEVFISGDNEISMHYTTQGGFSEEDSNVFIEEVKHAINSMITEYNYTQPFSILLNVMSRDGEEYGSIDTQLDFNTTDSSLTERLDDSSDAEKALETILDFLAKHEHIQEVFAQDFNLTIENGQLQDTSSLHIVDVINWIIENSNFEEELDKYLDGKEEEEPMTEQINKPSQLDANVVREAISEWYGVYFSEAELDHVVQTVLKASPDFESVLQALEDTIGFYLGTEDGELDGLADQIVGDIHFEGNTPINIEEELNKIDRESCKTDFLNMYEAANFSLDKKKELAKLLAEKASIRTLDKFFRHEGF